MKKIIILILIFLAAITIGIFIGMESEKNEISEPTVSNSVNTNTIEKAKKSIINNSANETTNLENQEDEVQKTDLEKAIDIAKQDWGEDDTVYFAEDGKTNAGEYIICVRENETTNAKAWYTINVIDGTFTRE